MRKLLTALLGFALAVSVASPAAAAGPLAQTSPAAGSTLSATEAGTLAAHWARFNILWTDLVKNANWPSTADNTAYSRFQGPIERILVNYFRENLKTETSRLGTGIAVDLQGGASVLMNLVDGDGNLIDIHGVQRERVYDRLGQPWPKGKYDEWSAFYDSFSSAFNAAAPRVMQYPESPSLMKDYGTQAQYGAEVGQLLYLHSKLEEEMPPTLVPTFGAVTTKLHSNIAVVMEATVCGPGGQGTPALEALLKGESRRDIYKILGHPWPASRWVTWDQLHKAFTKVNTTQI